jgi:hypothetical protein
MKKITSIAELREAIGLLEIKQVNEGRLLKEQFKNTYESLKPINLIKNTFNELTAAPDFKGNFLNTTLGLATGYFSKKVVIGATHNPLKQLFGTLLQIGVTSIVSKNTDRIKSTVLHLINNVSNKKNTSS